MDKTKDIKKVMELCGRTACFETDGQKSDGFLCIITSTWRKNKTNFEPTATPAGFAGVDFYVYLGPADRDITALPDTAFVVSAGQRFTFKRREAFLAGDKVQFYWGILRLCTEDEDGFYH